MKNVFFIKILVISMILIGISGCSYKAKENCANEGEQFSQVYKEEFPEHCCKGLTEWDSGMDTSTSIGNECYETGALSGSPVGTCINCGNGICESIESVCNCPGDCTNGKNSVYSSVEEFCVKGLKSSLSKECELGLGLPICKLC